MKGRHLKLAVLAVAGTAIAGLADTTWSWGDRGVDQDWDTFRNWIAQSESLYPSGPNDHPVIPTEPDDLNNYPNGWIIKLIDIEALGDMTIEGNVVFGDADPNDPNTPTIEPNTLTLDASEREEVLVVRMSGGRILVGPSPTE